MIRLLGIFREKENSPGRHQSNDAQLLERVADRLRDRALAIDVTTIDRVRASESMDATLPPDATLVLSMCQGRAALDVLAAWERAGAQIVNSPRAARNTYRDRLPALMAGAGVPFPETQVVSTSRSIGSSSAPVSPFGPVESSRGRGAGRAGRDRGADVPGVNLRLRSPAAGRAVLREMIAGGAWLKRGDVHASVSADVQRVDSLAALEAGCVEFASRGIAVAAVQAHRPGDEIKFYGVGTDFFYWFYSGPSRAHAFDCAALGRLAVRAAAAAGLEIFGGDVIVSPGGALTLIDLNDWPSFAPCRERAADAIAHYLTRRVHAAWNPGLVSSANESAV